MSLTNATTLQRYFGDAATEEIPVKEYKVEVFRSKDGKNLTFVIEGMTPDETKNILANAAFSRSSYHTEQEMHNDDYVMQLIDIDKKGGVCESVTMDYEGNAVYLKIGSWVIHAPGTYEGFRTTFREEGMTMNLLGHVVANGEFARLLV